MRHGCSKADVAGEKFGSLFFFAMSIGLLPLAREYLIKRGWTPAQASFIAAIPSGIGAAAALSVLRRKA